MLLKDACTPEVVCCRGRTNALEAAHLMRQKHVGDLVVVDAPDDERVPLGIVTDRDIVIEVLAKGLDPSTTSLTSVMHNPLVIALDSEDTGQVLERMRAHGVRRIPVVNSHGAAIGIVTLDDLLRLLVAEMNALFEVTDTGQRRERHLRR
jgi:CBS domain-containing protein